MNETNSNPVQEHFSPALESALSAIEQAEPGVGWRRTREILSGVGGFIKDPVVIGTVLALTLGPGLENQIAVHSGPAYELIDKVNTAASASGFGKEVLNVFAHAARMANPDIVGRDEIPLVQLAQMFDWGFTVLGSGYTAAKLAIPRAWEKLTHSRELAILAGTQPLRKNEVPDRVILGPRRLVSDFSRQKEKQENLVVAVHDDIQGVPGALGSSLDYHFPMSDFSDLKSARVLQETGMNRAKRLTFLCTNPDNGIFYGDDSHPSLSPNSISSVLRSLTPDQLNELEVDVLLSKGFDFLGKTTALVEEFVSLNQELGVNIHWRYLEDVVMDEFRGVIEKIKSGKKDGTVNILLAGEGKSMKDKNMLQRFSKALTDLDDKITVTVVDNDSIGDLDLDTTDDIKIERLNELLKQSDLNIVYGDSDDGTTEVAELLIRARGAERSQTVSVLESLSAVEEAKRANLLTLSLYEKAIDSIS